MSGIGTSEILIIIILSIALPVLVFLALRALLLWYWKIDILVANQEKQTKLLNEILMFLRDDAERKSNSR